VSGYNSNTPKRAYLAQSASLMTTSPTRTNASLVTLAANTTLFLTGTQSLTVTNTAANHGVQFAFTGLIVGTIYTFVAFVKSTLISDILNISVSLGTRSGNYPQVCASEQLFWNILTIPCLPDASGNLTIKIVNTAIGSFAIDSAQLWLGYRLDTPEVLLA
jgi:hypothetical protein